MKKRYIIPSVICVVMLILNIASRLSTDFADFYLMNIFPFLSVPMSFINGIFPFSVGEILIILAILLVVIGIPLTIILLIFMKKSRKTILRVFSLSVLWIFTYIFTTETLNCFIMYQCTPFSERYFDSDGEHSREELIELYEYLITESNKLAEEVSRDEYGYFVLSDDIDSNAKEAMNRASEDYPMLSGYYPDAKPIMSSFFMSQSGTLGIYFPFSMESNYNDDMCEINLPNTVCHEYAHLKGVIQEDEAGFIAFIASSRSDSADFRYSGFLNALEYVNNDIWENEVEEAYELSAQISPKVMMDWYRFLPETYWEENEEKEIISTETVDAVSDVATDTTLKLNDVEDGIDSYSRIVNLLLDYYATIK
ncbi:MAG: DUF3810 domain-containing protein [Ruminococcus sp.]|nr:DUF3810 domain-containing protein [Ruminococcus sp.]